MSAREKILDAAARVMLERGLVGSTTKEIARAAGYSEATLYKHFADKQDIFLGVLAERTPVLGTPSATSGETGEERRGAGEPAEGFEEGLRRMTLQLVSFYQRAFPMAVSIMSAPDLLATWRKGLEEKGVTGPSAPLRVLQQHIEASQASGAAPQGVDAEALAALLCGAAMQQAFFAHFDGRSEIAGIQDLVRRMVMTVRPAD